jgi:hypothetical protein
MGDYYANEDDDLSKCSATSIFCLAEWILLGVFNNQSSSHIYSTMGTVEVEQKSQHEYQTISRLPNVV